MNYYEPYEDIFDGEPLPEDLIESSFDENGNLLFGVRMMLIMELVGITAHLIGRQELPTTLRDRIAKMWATDANDLLNIRSDMDSFIAMWSDIDLGGR